LVLSYILAPLALIIFFAATRQGLSAFPANFFCLEPLDGRPRPNGIGSDGDDGLLDGTFWRNTRARKSVEAGSPRGGYNGAVRDWPLKGFVAFEAKT
jgi:hypothetical protein